MRVRIAVAGASGYAGGELLRLLLGHPGGGDRGADRRRQRGHAAGRAPAAPAAAGRPRPGRDHRGRSSPATTSCSSPCRTAGPPSWPRSSATTSSWSTAAPTTGSPTPTAWNRWYGGAYAGSWPYGLPELPGARDALRGARRVAVPGCYPTAATLALSPRARRGTRRARGRRHRGVRDVRRRQGAQAAPAGRRGDGRAGGLRRRRNPPAHARDRPELVGGRRSAGRA